MAGFIWTHPIQSNSTYSNLTWPRVPNEYFDIDIEVWWRIYSSVNHNWFSLLPLNSLPPGRFQFNFRWVIFKLALVNGVWGISYEIALRWMPLDLIDDKSTLVQVMAWCWQATSHYLSQCWPRSVSPYGVISPQWVFIRCQVNTLLIYCQMDPSKQNGRHFGRRHFEMNFLEWKW